MVSRVLFGLVALALPGLSLAQDNRKVSVADCSFANDPAEFLSRSSRARHAASQRTLKVAPSLARTKAVAATKRNFIDEEILSKLQKLNVAAAPLSSDEEFLRRIYLDLTGRIPGPEQVRAFLADTNADKRDVVIDKLLGSQEFTERWTMWMGDLLQNTSTLTTAAINRGPAGRNAFQSYLKDSVSADKSLKTLAVEVVSASGNIYETATGAANFPLGASTSMGPDQDTYDTMLAKTTAAFLGISAYDCLLCHNGRGHLTLVSSWGASQTRMSALQMAAFFSRMTFAAASSPARSFTVSDSSANGYNLNTNSGNRPDRNPIGTVSVVKPMYRDATDAPSGEWRQAFAQAMVADPMFARNMANRVWKQIFGLGLVDPVDSLDPARLDPANPPPDSVGLQATHPELLEKLAIEFSKGDFKLRAFVKTLVQSSAYQLSSRYEGEWKEEYVDLFARRIARRMEAEEVHDAVTKSTGILGDYALQGTSDRAVWAMQLPELTEPQADPPANNFLNTFLRGDRDTQGRSQSGSIQQQLLLMNDAFVGNRLKVTRSPRLQGIAKLDKNEDVVEEAYLTFLSRKPTAAEREVGVVFLSKASNRDTAIEDLAWMCINKTEFLFSY